MLTGAVAASPPPATATNAVPTTHPTATPTPNSTTATPASAPTTPAPTTPAAAIEPAPVVTTPDAPTVLNLAGVWTGALTSASGTDGFRLDLVQSGTQITGTGRDQTNAMGDLTGTVSGNTFSFHQTRLDQCPGGGVCCLLQGTLGYSAGTLTGTWTTGNLNADQRCAGYSGELTLSHTA
jgi:hypothetical protein